jgi:hypothetical protein
MKFNLNSSSKRNQKHGSTFSIQHVEQERHLLTVHNPMASPNCSDLKNKACSTHVDSTPEKLKPKKILTEKKISKHKDKLGPQNSKASTSTREVNISGKVKKKHEALMGTDSASNEGNDNFQKSKTPQDMKFNLNSSSKRNQKHGSTVLNSTCRARKSFTTVHNPMASPNFIFSQHLESQGTRKM